MAIWNSNGCQWISPEQDPQRNYPLSYCGESTLTGKNYCHEHYFRMYQKGTSVNGRKASKLIEREIAEVQRLEEIAEIANETIE